MELQFGVTIGVLVYMAFVFDLFGFLARDELWLRLLMLAASALYLFYYYHVAEAPLWDAILTNAALGAANLAMIVVVVLERTTFSMSRETAELYRRFAMLSPGQFRRLLKAGTAVQATAADSLTQEGMPVERLYYIVEGPVRIDKGQRQTPVGAGIFVGEIGFLTGMAATASVLAEPGTRYLRWDAQVLRRLMDKSPKFEIAMQAQFNADLVGKVARSVPGLAG